MESFEEFMVTPKKDSYLHCKTTREDYDLAVKEILAGPVPHDSCCLIAQTIKRVTGAACRVGFTGVRFNTNSARVNTGDYIKLSDEAVRAIDKFDSAFGTESIDGVWKKVLRRDGFMEAEFDLPLDKIPTLVQE